MTRVFFTLAILCFFSLFEISFMSFLPSFLPLVPFVFTTTVFLFQEQREAVVLWWLPVHGFFLDYFHLGAVPLEVFWYLLSAMVAWWVTKQLFSHRSLYGMVGSVSVSYVVLLIMETGVFVLSLMFFSDASFSLPFWLRHIALQFMLMVTYTNVLFLFFKPLCSTVLHHRHNI